MSPRFTHDCNNCLLIGARYAYDIYLCITANGIDFIARYGNDAHEYVSSQLTTQPRLATLLDCLDSNHKEVL
jgi:hypothetical protein